MKKIATFIAIFFVTITTYAQHRCLPNRETGVAVGLSGGYSNKNMLTGNFSLGAMLKGANHVSMNLQLFSNPSAVNVPVIGEARVGHVFKTLEVYGGLGYHYAGIEHGNKSSVYDYKNGLKPAYGILKHFNKSLWTVGAGMNGNIFSVQVGVFAIR